MAEKKGKHETVTVEFRGQEFEVDKTAFSSLKVQTSLSLASADPAKYGAASNEAMDLICCGKLIEYIGRIPDTDGNLPGEMGCSQDDWNAFTAAVAEAVSKN